MKTGVDVKVLSMYAFYLKPLFELDERGGYFRQNDMQQAIRMNVDLSVNKAAWAAWNLTQ